MKYLRRIPIVLLLVPALSAASFTPDAAIHRAVTHQPELTAARWLLAEARARGGQAGRLANPEVEVEIQPNTNGREGVLAFGLTQRFPLSSRLRAERAASEADIAAAAAELREAEHQMARRSALAVADWLAARARLELTDRQLTNARASAANLQAAAAKGEAPRVDALQLTLEVGQVALRRRQVEKEQVGLRGELYRLLSLPAAEPLELSGALPEAGASLPAMAEAPSEADPWPEVQVAIARLEAARRQGWLARAQRWQDVGIGLVSELQRSEDQPAGVRRDDLVGLRVSVPLPFWNRNQGHVRGAEALVERRRLELEAVRLRVRSEQEAARETLELATAMEREWREKQLPLARELEEQLRLQSEQGQASVTDWARARERRLQSESGHLEARHVLLRAWLEAQAASGRLPRFPESPGPSLRTP